MQKYLSAVIIGSLCFCCTCGCLQSAPGAQDAGIEPVTGEGAGPVLLGDAIAALDAGMADALFSFSGYLAYTVIGSGVNGDGAAESWSLLVVPEGRNETRLLTFTGSSWQDAAWPEEPGNVTAACSMDEILMPEELFAQNRGVLEEMMKANGVVATDIELNRGVYHVRARGGSDMRELRFDARTGEPLQ